METSDPADKIMSVISSDSNLNKPLAGESTISANDVEENTTENSKLNNTPKRSNNDDDQASVIIEEIANKTIELNDDSDEEVDLDIEERTEDLSNTTGKSTEFVVVNAADLIVSDVVETGATNRYEDIQIKDELAETITADTNTNDILENDPMDLLELNNRSESSSSMKSQEETDYPDDVSSIGSSSARTGSSSSISVQDWIKEYPWLLYDEGDEPCGYCLYCDAKINTKSQRSVKQHGLSLYHKERCENYLAFREEEEKNGLGMKLIEIKEEFGTDSRVEALKLKRKSQSGALNNFNWRRWLEDCPWLDRDSTEGTIGFCKYCLIHVNVEFSYLRERHQECAKHREAEKHHEGREETGEQYKQTNVNEEKDYDPTIDSSPSNSHRWLEIIKKEPTMVRCKVCGHKMFKNNFLRHLRTNLHVHNERIYLQTEKAMKETKADDETSKDKNNWKLYTKHHPWMVSDPEDPSFAYCKYCEKRFIYAASSAKRATHENSSQHKQNEVEYKKRSSIASTGKNHDVNNSESEQGRNDNDEPDQRTDEEEDVDEEKNENEKGDCEDDDEDNDVDNEDNDKDGDEEGEDDDNNEKDEEEQGKQSDDENESKKRVYRLSDEWLNQYSWCKKYTKNPSNFIFCIYCRIPLRVASSRSKHQTSSFHISAEKKFLSRQAKKQKLQDRKQSNENSPFYEWAIHLRNNPSNYSCRYCRVRISKNYSKKQHASSKIHQINESIYKNNRRKSLRSDETTNAITSPQTSKNAAQLLNNGPTKKIQTFAKVVIKAPSTVTLIKQYQKKFPWLSYKRSELRSNYGHCKVCDSSLYIRSLKHVLRHSRSGRHISILKSQKKEKVEKNEEADGEDSSLKIMKKGSKEELQTSLTSAENLSQNQLKPPTKTGAEVSATAETQPEKPFNYKSTIAEMKKRFSWIEQSERPNYAFCRFCISNIPLKILFLRNHSNSHKHRRCVINYYSVDGKTISKETEVSNNADLDENNSRPGDNDVIMLEDNNEEILISEQDENWTVKSETMDEHEELDYLLQRSFSNNIGTSNMQRNVRKNLNSNGQPPAKRMRRSQPFKRLNDTNTSLVASLLTTPLTLASCLGPLIQQQIQQQANFSQISQTKCNDSTTSDAGASKAPTAAVTEPENTYDLFFKSISETMKKLPVDLAAEGKLRVMQIICDLELQALKRLQCERNESACSNTSSGLNNQVASTSTGILPGCNSSAVNEINEEQTGNGNETIITQLNTNTDVAPLTTNTNTPSIVPNQVNVEKPSTSCATSPIIGVMDKNGLQTLQFKTSVPKQIPRNPTTTPVTSVTYSTGIRCIPFKNLSQPAAPDSSNTKITRIQVPITQTTNPNTNAANTSKNLINFRNIQITKRIGTPPTSVTGPQQTVQTSAITSKSPQRTFITNIQPQLQRWGCSVNGATPHHTTTSPAVNHHLQHLSSHQTSTPISKK